MTVIDPTSIPFIWATLITNKNYLQGVLTLNYSLIKVKSKYPLIALYTDQLDENSLQSLSNANILTLKIDSLNPTNSNINKNLFHDKRFFDTWSKLYFFKLIQFKRIIQLDSDMLIMKNIDELMDLSLNNKKFASTHACVCNPLKKSHYPKDWLPSNCAFTNYDSNIINNEILGPSCKSGLSKCNSGLLIVEPSIESFNIILDTLNNDLKTQSYLFPDQDLLADVFHQDWLPISHNYNCLKTYKQFHPQLWDISKIKIIHYILAPKPWDVNSSNYIDESETFHLWWNENNERLSSLKNLN
ncbi:hypothetical protein C6P40_003227 [Pichia californica]|uniref:Glycosyltransferase family 8 protein n=1 Tax=Pichia californica TaxID=460514 RepID=A0A9P7BI39_9ASCO|nr:hypothetical protein C6P42_004287 [[Candida] californica]KAG0690303.1 hypothetical protein C6P40_003227 [[Candida] californica]